MVHIACGARLGSVHARPTANRSGAGEGRAESGATSRRSTGWLCFPSLPHLTSARPLPITMPLQAAIQLDPIRVLGDISPLIYSGFTEHMVRSGHGFCLRT